MRQSATFFLRFLREYLNILRPNGVTNEGKREACLGMADLDSSAVDAAAVITSASLRRLHRATMHARPQGQVGGRARLARLALVHSPFLKGAHSYMIEG